MYHCDDQLYRLINAMIIQFNNRNLFFFLTVSLRTPCKKETLFLIKFRKKNPNLRLML